MGGSGGRTGDGRSGFGSGRSGFGFGGRLGSGSGVGMDEGMLGTEKADCFAARVTASCNGGTARSSGPESATGVERLAPCTGTAPSPLRLCCAGAS